MRDYCTPSQSRPSMGKPRPYSYLLRDTEADTLSLDKPNRVG